MGKLYRDKEWLHDQYIVKNKTRDSIAIDQGVSSVTIKKTLKKFHIYKGHNNQNKKPDVVITCGFCGNNANKSHKYYTERIKEGINTFYCSRECADKVHSESMKGEGNPNYEGSFHGQPFSEKDKEKKQEIARKISQTMVRKGISKGSSNPRWNGGLHTYKCTVCGKTTYKRPYEHEKIQNEEKSPLCSSSECSIAYMRRFRKVKNTSIEIAMADELRKRNIHYIEQFEIAGRYISDFYLPDYNIIVECDGNYWHSLPEVVERDIRKNKAIEDEGYELYRFWETDINADVKGCVDSIFTNKNKTRELQQTV